MNDLDPKAQALLDSIRGADRPTRHEKTRVRRRVLARVAGVVLAASAGTASTTTAAAGIWSAKMAIVAVAVSALIAGGAATGVVVSRHDAPRWVTASVSQAKAPVAASAPVATSPVVAPMSAASATPPEPVGSAQPRATDPRGAPPRAPVARPALAPMDPPTTSPETLEEELPLLQSAQEALRLGDADRALRLLDAHAKRFPAGALAEERRAAHALAACRRTRDPLARAEAAAFLRDSPSSPLVESVRKACSLAEP
jgi:hypothetical protein